MGYDYGPKGRKPRKGDDLKLIWLLLLVGGGITVAIVYFTITK
ncbi:hypothetical protein BH09VER1_BH09VER1_35930 [soil metagenome]